MYPRTSVDAAAASTLAAARYSVDKPSAAISATSAINAAAGELLYGTTAAATAKQRLRLLLGAHPSTGAFEDVMRTFRPPSQTLTHAAGPELPGRLGTGANGSSSGVGPRDLPVGKDVDAAVAGLEWVAAYARASPVVAATVYTRVLPALRAALGVAGDGHARRTMAASAAGVWAAVDAVEPPPPPPPEGHRDEHNHRSLSSTPQPTLRQPQQRPAPLAAWPSDAPPPTAFSALRTVAAVKPPCNVAVVGAVVIREPSAGTRKIQNPKTGRTYDVVMLTLVDHTGARVKAQLIGGKARECAKVLDGAGTGRVVIGLYGVMVQEKVPGKGSAGGVAAIAAVWDPREESTLVLRPNHPAALKL